MSRTLALICATFAGCSIEPTIEGSGRLTTETRETANFSAIACEVSCAVDVRKGEKTSVVLMMDDNLLPMIRTEVADQELRIQSAKNIAPDDRAIIIITTPSLNTFSATGAVKATIPELTGDAMAISIEGSGSVTGKAAGKALKIEIAGSGDVNLSGTSEQLNICIAGSGDILTTELAADDVQVEIAGSGDVRIQAQKTLKVSIAGSGTVSFTGEAIVRQSIAGSGSVRNTISRGQLSGHDSPSLPDNQGKADAKERV